MTIVRLHTCSQFYLLSMQKEKEVKRQRLALEQQSDVQSDSRSSSTLLPVESKCTAPA